MPLPPPPAAAFSITGNPYFCAVSLASASDGSGSTVPGTIGTPASTAARRALVFDPITSIASAACRGFQHHRIAKLVSSLRRLIKRRERFYSSRNNRNAGFNRGPPCARFRSHNLHRFRRLPRLSTSPDSQTCQQSSSPHQKTGAVLQFPEQSERRLQPRPAVRSFSI